jgi:nitrite reductase (NADH) small subunit
MARTADLPPGTVIEVEHGDDLVAICNVAGELRAIDGRCPHQGGPLGEGVLTGGTVACPWHMWEFDTRTGECGFNPNLKLAVYPVREQGGEVLVDLP